LLLVAAGALHAAEPAGFSPVRTTNAPGGFSLALPDCWNEMNPRFSVMFVDVEKVGPARNVDAFGYQLNPTNEFAAPPFISIQVARRGGLSGAGLDMLNDACVRKSAALLRLRGEGVEPDDIVSSSFDPIRRSLRIEYRRTDAMLGQLHAIDFVQFLRRGSVNVNCVATEEAFEECHALFNAALSSLTLQPTFEAALSPPLPAGAGLSALKSRLSMLGVLFVAMTVGRFYLSREPKVMSDEI
jgi:hypothetical protein